MKQTFFALLLCLFSSQIIMPSDAQELQDPIMTYIKLGEPHNVIYLIQKGNKATFAHLTYALQSLNNENGISAKEKRFEVISHLEDALEMPKENRITFHF